MVGGRYIVVEGPIGVGKAALARKLSESLKARLVLEEAEANPFLEDFQRDRQRYAFQAQLFFLLSRFKRHQELAQLDLFKRDTVGDCLFERDRIFALVNLAEDELILYDQIFTLLLERVPQPDLVIYLSSRTDVLWKRIRNRQEPVEMTQDYLEELNEAYNYFFFHYDRAPLLVVNTSDAGFMEDEDNYRHLLTEVKRHRKGVKHYVPLGSRGVGLRRGD